MIETTRWSMSAKDALEVDELSPIGTDEVQEKQAAHPGPQPTGYTTTAKCSPLEPPGTSVR